MVYNTTELLSLPNEEKVALAEALWSSVEDDLEITSDDIAFAEERLKMHEANPNEGMTLEEFKNRFTTKHGF